MIFFRLIILLAIVGLVSCESMEDTYSEYTKDGKSRYLGRVKDVSVESGWKRMKVSWENSNDSNVDSIMIVFSSDQYIDTIMLDKDVTSYETESNLENKIYTFDIYSLDEDRDLSLKTSVVGKPFTEHHEDIIHVSMIKKHFLIGDKLLAKLRYPDSKIQKTVLKYFVGDEEQEREILKQETWNPGYIVIEDINTDKPITLNEDLFVEGCYDPIHMNDQELSTNLFNFDQDFKNELKHSHNVTLIDEAFINSTETLYLDYDVSSLEDVAYFPNLKKIVLGKHRYFRGYSSESAIKDYKSQTFSYQIFENLISKRNVEVEMWGSHYYPVNYVRNSNNLTEEDKARVTKYDSSVLPEIDYFDMSEWTITSSSTIEGHDDNVEGLLDSDFATKWVPFSITGNMRIHEIVIDMKEIKNLNGFLVNQSEDWSEYRQTQFQILVSTDGNSWRSPFSYKYCMMGKSDGETAIFNIKEGSEVSARYVKLVINDVVSLWSDVKYVELGDIIPF